MMVEVGVVLRKHTFRDNVVSLSRVLNGKQGKCSDGNEKPIYFLMPKCVIGCFHLFHPQLYLAHQWQMNFLKHSFLSVDRNMSL